MIETLVEGLDHPECVAWGPDGFLYAGGEAGQIYKIDIGRRSFAEIANTGGSVLGIALDNQCNVYACDHKRRAVLVISPSGQVRPFSAGSLDRPMTFPNFPVFHSSGALFVSDSGKWPEGGGCIYRIAPDGEATVWSTGSPQFTNGLAISPAGDAIYAVESTMPGITRIPIECDGSAGTAEPVVSLPGTVPDGLAFDIEGRLYIGCYRPDRIYTLEPDGRLLIFADDYQGTVLAAPTNLAFGGPNHGTLYIASLGRWHVGQTAVQVPGARLNYPDTLNSQTAQRR